MPAIDRDPIDDFCNSPADFRAIAARDAGRSGSASRRSFKNRLLTAEIESINGPRSARVTIAAMLVNRLALASLTAAIVSLSAASSLAAPSPKEKAEARTLVNDAKKAMKDKRWGDAVGALKKADKLDPSPAIELDLAQAQINLGKLLDASKTLAAIEGNADKGAAAKKARESAAKMLADLKAKIPTVKVTVKGPAGKASVTLDGLEVDASGEIPVDPGDHNVGASAAGFKAIEKEVKLAEGARQTVELALVADAPAAPKEEEKGSRVPGIVLTSIGGAALVVGGVFGGLAFSATSSAKAQCKGNLCPASAESDISRSKLYGNVSTGMLIGGGAVAVTGIVLAIVAPGGKKSDEAPKSARVMRVVPWMGADQIGVAGTF